MEQRPICIMVVPSMNSTPDAILTEGGIDYFGLFYRFPKRREMSMAMAIRIYWLAHQDQFQVSHTYTSILILI